MNSRFGPGLRRRALGINEALRGETISQRFSRFFFSFFWPSGLLRPPSSTHSAVISSKGCSVNFHAREKLNYLPFLAHPRVCLLNIPFHEVVAAVNLLPPRELKAASETCDVQGEEADLAAFQLIVLL